MAKVMVLIWAAAITAGIVQPVDKGYPADWNKSFEVSGQSRNWQVQSLFSPADFTKTGDRTELGFEFSTGTLIYTGKPTRLRWYRMAILLPGELSIGVNPDAPDNPSACAVDTRGGLLAEPPMLAPGEHFNHGKCVVYPWQRSASDLANKVTKGIYVVSWEDDMGTTQRYYRSPMCDGNETGGDPPEH